MSARQVLLLRPEVTFLRRDASVELIAYDRVFGLEGRNAYALLERLVPFFNAEWTIEELLSKAPPAQQAQLEAICRKLISGGVVQEIRAADPPLSDVSERERRAIWYLATLVADPFAAYRSLRSARIFLIGDAGEVAAITKSLSALGPPFEALAVEIPAIGPCTLLTAGSDASVPAPGDVAISLFETDRRRAADLAFYCAKTALRLFLLGQDDGLGYLAPLAPGDAPPCRSCVLDTLGPVRTHWREQLALLPPPKRPGPFIANTLRSEAALAVFNHFTGLNTPRLVSATFILNVISGSMGMLSGPTPCSCLGKAWSDAVVELAPASER